MHTVIRAVLVTSFILVPTTTLMAQDAITHPLTSAVEDVGDDDDIDDHIDEQAPVRNQPIDVEFVSVDAEAVEKALIVESKPIQDMRWQSMTPAYHEQSPLPIQGRAMYYNPGVMKLVLENRLASGAVQECPECIGYVAMLRYGDLNRKVWIQLADSRIEGPFLVADAADTKHVGMLLDKKWVIDVDHETARRWNMWNPKSVTVLANPWPEQQYDEAVAERIHNQGETDVYRSSKLGVLNRAPEYEGAEQALYVK